MEKRIYLFEDIDAMNFSLNRKENDHNEDKVSNNEDKKLTDEDKLEKLYQVKVMA